MIPLKIKLCLSFFIVVKNKALVKAQTTIPDGLEINPMTFPFNQPMLYYPL